MERRLQSALRNEAARVKDAPNGERNDTLNRAAFALGTLAECVAAAMHSSACAPHLSWTCTHTAAGVKSPTHDPAADGGGTGC